MKRTDTPIPTKLIMLAAALFLATTLSVAIATPLRSEPGGGEDTNFPDPATAERPVAIAKGFNDSEPPDIQPEPAVSPEIREIKQRMAQQRRAERQKAQRLAAQQEAERRKAERRKAERRKAERRKAERRKAEHREAEWQAERQAERRRIERQKAKAARAAAAQKVRPLPAGVSERARAQPTNPKGSNTQRSAPRVGKMALSIESIGLRNSKIETTSSQQALDRGLIHLPQTSRPWERRKSRNVYVVGHRMGWPGTKSWKIFYRLDELKRGDTLVLKAGPKTYRYKVSEKLVVSPWDVWVTEPVKGRDLLTLQTCTGPDFGKRLIIRADRVD